MRLKEKEGKKKSSFISIITNVRGNNVENKNGIEINLDKKFTSERLLAVIKLKPYKKDMIYIRSRSILPILIEIRRFVKSENFLFSSFLHYVKKRNSRLILEFKLNPLLLSASSEREFREK